MPATRTARPIHTRTWGVWTPVPEEAAPLGAPYARPLEWWPSVRAAETSLRARVQTSPGSVNTDVERRADGTVRTDAQFYGGPGSAVLLYAVTGEPGAEPVPAAAPYAVLEFGPRGGVRRRRLTPA
ncbi:hypothetical protein ACGFXC_37060 [Streptomyces sp. NPDC048507]|uniref:hypothetical protein n=1 Tax=Streptomyces sp. NPDC048507 TaxID=3365560 RepID=UPI00371378A7